MDSSTPHENPQRLLAAGALILNERNEILIVKPTYRDYWEIPGGIVEPNESPISACVREIREELGLLLKVDRLLCLEYRNREKAASENLHFVFLGGVWGDEEMSDVSVAKEELEGFAFVRLPEAELKLHPRVYFRIVAAVESLKSGGTAYLENGERLG